MLVYGRDWNGNILSITRMMEVKKAIAEAELVKLLGNKDINAIGILYDQYAAPLYGSILKLVQDEKMACEVLESTFLEVWSKFPKENCLKISLFAWMNNVGRDMALSKLAERIRCTQSGESISYYKTVLGTVLTAVNFT
jgi:hypothetical protein